MSRLLLTTEYLRISIFLINKYPDVSQVTTLTNDARSRMTHALHKGESTLETFSTLAQGAK